MNLSESGWRDPSVGSGRFQIEDVLNDR